MFQSCKDIALQLENKPFLHCTESLKRNDIEHFVYKWQIDIISEF